MPARPTSKRVYRRLTQSRSRGAPCRRRDQLAAVGVVVTEGVDLLAGVGRQVNDFFGKSPCCSAQGSARNIQAGPTSRYEPEVVCVRLTHLANVLRVHRRAAGQKAGLRE